MGVQTLVIVWTLYLVAGGAAVTSWTAQCGTQDNGCELVETECGPLGSNISGTTQNLSITPVFTEFMSGNDSWYPRLHGNDRWYPRLNISFLSEFGNEDSHFTIRIAYRGKQGFLTRQTCDQCFNLTIRGHTSQHSKSSQTDQIITLLSGDVKDCDPALRPLFLYIRVRGVEYTEGSISLPNNDPTEGLKGLPSCYRRIVPDASRNVSCCLNWNTPLVVRNSSCHRAIVVEFEMAPKGCIKGYQVELGHSGFRIRPPIQVNATEDIKFGRVTFTNVSLGIYYVSLKVLPSSSRYTDVVSGNVSISDTMDCTMERWDWSREIPHGGIELPRLLLIVFSITITLLLILTLIFAVILKKTVTDKPFPPPDDTTIPEEPRPRKKTVLLVYCMDNSAHRMVVRKLAALLQTVGMCDVILDQWQLKSILEEGIASWVGKQYEKADKVIVVGSEGVYNFIDAKRKDYYWPVLEHAFPLSRVFPFAVKVLQDSVSAHTKSKTLALTFAYTEENPASSKAMKELTCNDIHYRLSKDIERLMLSIHDTSKYQYGNSIMEWGTNILKTKAWQQLEIAISNAVQFHQPNWFREHYGKAKPYPHIEAKKNTLNGSCGKDGSLYYIKDPEELDLIPPEVCTEDQELELSKAVFLIGPTDLPAADEPDLVGPEDCESDSNPDLDIGYSTATPLVSPSDRLVSGNPDLIAQEDSETDSNPELENDSHLIEQYDRRQEDIGPAILCKPRMRGVPIRENTPGGSSSSSSFVDHLDSGIGMSDRSTALGSLRVRSVPLTSYCLEDGRHGCDQVDECDLDYGDGHGLIHPPSSLSSPSSVGSSESTSSSQSLMADLPPGVGLMLPHLDTPRLPV